MFSKKINQLELTELKKRAELINSYKLVVGGLEIQKDLYLRNILPKYGCDANKNYSIDFETGRISEVKVKSEK